MSASEWHYARVERHAAGWAVLLCADPDNFTRACVVPDRIEALTVAANLERIALRIVRDALVDQLVTVGR